MFQSSLIKEILEERDYLDQHCRFRMKSLHIKPSLWNKIFIEMTEHTHNKLSVVPTQSFFGLDVHMLEENGLVQWKLQ